MMDWVYNGEPYTEKHDDSLYGFIYCIHFEAGNGELYSYYGKKKLFREITKHFGKKKLAEITDGRKKTYEIVVSDSDWRTYIGSSKETSNYIPIHKEIICFTRSQREHTYMETKVLFMKGALEDDKCLNANILKKFFRGRLV